ncbi:MAG: M23 family metallopeptidase [Gemmatimonadota bacterium]|nr:M23 family metallopeptidase [Gemmatimonadota bacterium]
MIFHADGSSRNVSLDFFKVLRLTFAVLVVAFISVTVITCYNYLGLMNIKSSYTQTMQNQSLEKLTLNQRISRIENFEEKISFFLSGAITSQAGVEERLAMGDGEGEEEGDVLSRETLEEPELTGLSSKKDETGDVGMRAARLRVSLEHLALKAVKEKKRLDFTPSVRPVQGYTSSGFGMRRSPFTSRMHFHRGVDIVNKIGTPVRATATGEVIFAGKQKFWGNSVFIKHINGMVSKFGHLKSYSVSRGDKVIRGDLIGEMGMSGRSTGPHLHYQIEIGEQAVDPMQFIIDETD